MRKAVAARSTKSSERRSGDDFRSGFRLNICMSLESAAVKMANVSHRIKAEPCGVLTPRKTATGEVVGRVIGAESLYIDAVADGVDIVEPSAEKSIWNADRDGRRFPVRTLCPCAAD